jgi:hypothetical protein
VAVTVPHYYFTCENISTDGLSIQEECNLEKRRVYEAKGQKQYLQFAYIPYCPNT